VSFAIGSDYLQFLWRKRIAIGYSNHYSRFSGSTGELSHFVQGKIVGIDRNVPSALNDFEKVFLCHIDFILV